MSAGPGGPPQEAQGTEKRPSPAHPAGSSLAQEAPAGEQAPHLDEDLRTKGGRSSEGARSRRIGAVARFLLRWNLEAKPV